MCSNLTPNRLEQIRGLLLDYLMPEYSLEESVKKIQEATISEDKDEVTVVYKNGAIELLKIKYRPYLEQLHHSPLKSE